MNPGSVILSGEMMLRYMGWTDAADRIVKGLEATIAQKVVTYDFARLMDGAREVKCSEFATAIVENMRRVRPVTCVDGSRRRRRARASAGPGSAGTVGSQGLTPGEVNMARPKVTVVGAGNVGATTAQYIVERELADVVLTDVVEGCRRARRSTSSRRGRSTATTAGSPAPTTTRRPPGPTSS